MNTVKTPTKKYCLGLEVTGDDLVQVIEHGNYETARLVYSEEMLIKIAKDSQMHYTSSEEEKELNIKNIDSAIEYMSIDCSYSLVNLNDVLLVLNEESGSEFAYNSNRKYPSITTIAAQCALEQLVLDKELIVEIEEEEVTND